MFIARWIEDSGAGNYVAPDENYNPGPSEPGQGPLWEIVAPNDTRGCRKSPRPPAAAFSLPSRVKCEHCHRLTRTDVLSTPVSTSKKAQTRTPASIRKPAFASPVQQDLVLQASTGYAESLSSATQMADKNIFEFCVLEDAKRPEKQQKKFTQRLDKLRVTLTTYPDMLLMRSSRSQNPPDGYTPLMAAAHGGNVEIATVLLECGSVAEQLEARNLAGQTALHVAATRGNVELAALLEEESGKLSIHTQTDSIGHTAYASAMTSPVAKAILRRKELADVLQSGKKQAIYGHTEPVLGELEQGQLVFTVAEMPGHRIMMEDATLAQELSDGAALFAVCDGHGDSGKVSDFVARHLEHIFDQVVDNWAEHCEHECLSLDAKLKSSGLQGGSTSVIARVSDDAIVVSNIGDSRCILVRESQSLEERTENLSLDSPASNSSGYLWNNYEAKAMSVDHKPSDSLESERIQKAGMKVVEEKCDDGLIISKVAHPKGNLLAVARAFGDFEFKKTKELSASEQAVIAVPDVIIHQRTDTDSFLILACDGIWDVMSNDQAGQFVVEALVSGMSLPGTADALLRECIQKGSTDNLSVIIVDLKATKKRASGRVLFPTQK